MRLLLEEAPFFWPLQLRCGRAAALVVAVSMFLIEVAVAQQLPVLRTSRATYSNVVVTGTSADHIFVRHAGGVATIKVADLSADAARQLGILKAPATPAPASTGQLAIATPARPPSGVQDHPAEIQGPKSVERVREFWTNFRAGFINGVAPAPDAPRRTTNESNSWMGVVFAMTASILIYVLYCTVLYRLCQAGNGQGSMLVFVPGLRWIPMFRAANMPAQCVLASIGLFVAVICPPPIHSIIGFMAFLAIVGLLLAATLLLHVVWSFKICTEFNRSALLGFLVLLPITNPFALAYLAHTGIKEPA